MKEQQIGLLSRQASVKLGMISLISEVETMYEGLGQLNTEYKFKLKNDAVPNYIYVPRPISLRLQEEVKGELNRMKNLGVIVESEGP